VVHIITAANRPEYAAQIDEMHQDRKRVFVDTLKWRVPVVGGKYEIDQFDDADAIYLLESEPKTGKHLASLRLLASTKPNLLRDVFPHLCSVPLPVGEDVMELTRFCVSPDVEKLDAVNLMNRMWSAAVEYAMLFGIERYTCISHRQFLSVMLSAGWGAEPLGDLKECDGQLIGAILFKVTPATLRECRRRYGYRGPVLEVLPQAEAA